MSTFYLTPLRSIESAQKAYFESTHASDVMEGRYAADLTAGQRIIIAYMTCIFQRLNAINSDNSMNGEIVESAIRGISEIELLKMNKGQPSDQKVSINDEAMFDGLSEAIRNCVTKSDIAEDSVILLVQCLSTSTNAPFF
ncbi:hypothetical protein KQX54_011776 [Cotesia glomerata]|uniref:Uncharacterized protein n=1 Tax=Cotesia glomerata TaxID=32391 RepID=A0AAV7J612_COTGL|nr:hypothetical protein KQX54_011776 [Cotesia glomerata]